MAMCGPAWSDVMAKTDTSPALTLPIGDELARLEEIVRKLEADDVELDAALALFEEGVARLRAARERLVAAELKVQAVLEEADGDIRLTDLDA
jgi:exodeoxyribonuclease VII small subunit